MEKLKAMISQPMAGKTDEEIVEARNKAVDYLEGLGYEVVNTFFTDEWYSKEKMEERGVRQIPLCFLAKSLENMSLCDVVYFVDGWYETRGCKAEYIVAQEYGLKIIIDGEDSLQKLIVVTETEHNYMEKSSQFLSALEAAGVDNWEGYCVAQEIYSNEGNEER